MDQERVRARTAVHRAGAAHQVRRGRRAGGHLLAGGRAQERAPGPRRGEQPPVHHRPDPDPRFTGLRGRKGPAPPPGAQVEREHQVAVDLAHHRHLPVGHARRERGRVRLGVEHSPADDVVDEHPRAEVGGIRRSRPASPRGVATAPDHRPARRPCRASAWRRAGRTSNRPVPVTPPRSQPEVVDLFDIPLRRGRVRQRRSGRPTALSTRVHQADHRVLGGIARPPPRVTTSATRHVSRRLRSTCRSPPTARSPPCHRHRSRRAAGAEVPQLSPAIPGRSRASPRPTGSPVRCRPPAPGPTGDASRKIIDSHSIGGVRPRAHIARTRPGSASRNHSIVARTIIFGMFKDRLA